jgi:hypothetical protein
MGSPSIVPRSLPRDHTLHKTLYITFPALPRGGHRVRALFRREAGGRQGIRPHQRRRRAVAPQGAAYRHPGQPTNLHTLFARTPPSCDRESRRLKPPLRVRAESIESKRERAISPLGRRAADQLPPSLSLSLFLSLSVSSPSSLLLSCLLYGVNTHTGGLASASRESMTAEARPLHVIVRSCC